MKIARQALRGLLLLLAAMVTLTAIGVVALAWRLGEGPLSLTFLRPALEEALSSADERTLVVIDTVQLTWSEQGRTLELQAKGVRALEEDRLLAEIPQARIGLSAWALVQGRLSPTRISLIGPALAIQRQKDGSLDLDLGAGAGGGTGMTESMSLEAVLEGLLPTPGQTGKGRLARLSDIGIYDANVVLHDQVLERTWEIPDVMIHLRRTETGIEGESSLGLALGGQQVRLDLVAALRQDREEVQLSAVLPALEPGWVAPIMPAVRHLEALQVPFSGRIDATSGFDGTLRSLRFRIDGGAGALGWPGSRVPVIVEGLRIEGAIPDPEGLTFGRMALEPSQLQLSVSAAMQLPLKDRPPIPIRFAANHAPGTAPIQVSASLGSAQPALLAKRLAALAKGVDLSVPVPPQLSWIDLPVSVTVNGEVGMDGTLRQAHLGIQADKGTLTIPTILVEPVMLSGLALNARIENNGDRISVSPLVLQLGEQTSAAILADLRRIDQTWLVRSEVTLDALPTNQMIKLWPQIEGDNSRKWVSANIRDGMITKAELSLEGYLDTATLAPEDADRDAAGDWKLKRFPGPEGRLLTLPVAKPAPPPRPEPATGHGGKGSSAGTPPSGTASSPEDGGGLVLSSLAGWAQMQGVSITYIDGLPPLRNVDAVGTSDGKALRFLLGTGHSGGVALEGGRLSITGLDQSRQELDLQTELTGSLPAVLGLLDHPPLGYPSKVNIKPAHTKGRVAGTLTMRFPLLDALRFDDIALHSRFDVKEATLQDIALGADLTEGTISGEVDTDQLHLSGEARFGGMPVQARWLEIFDPVASDSALRSHLRASGISDKAGRRGLGFTFLDPILEGPVPVTLDLKTPTGRSTHIDLTADLAQASMTLPGLPWRKTAGQSGSARLQVRLANGQVQSIEDIEVRTPDASLQQARLLFQRGTLVGATAERVRLLSSQLHKLGVRFGQGRLGLSVGGGSLDLEPLLERADQGNTPGSAAPSSQGSSASQQKGGPLAEFDFEPALPLAIGLDGRFTRIRLGPGRSLDSVALSLVHDGTQWEKLALKGTMPPSVRGGRRPEFNLRFLRQKKPWELIVHTKDIGGFLRLLDHPNRIKGGELALSANFHDDKDGRPLIGRLEVRNYRLLNAPALAKLLTLASFTGLLDLLSAQEGLPFARLKGEFGYRGKKLFLHGVKTYSDALGIFVDGMIDLGQGRLDLKGTVAPAYVLSQIIDIIPGGELIVGREGTGLFAVEYTARGDLEDPSISVNPLSALAPPILYELFGDLDEAENGAKQ